MGIFDGILGQGQKHSDKHYPPKPDIPSDAIISPDTSRENRIPPGQHRAVRWPVLHAGTIPQIDLETWTFDMFGLLDKPAQFTWKEFQQLPRVKVYSDLHCVTTWSLLDNLWEGVSTREIIKHVNIKPGVQFVLVHAEHGWTTNMPLEWFLSEDSLFVLKYNGEPLTAEHGAPMRLVVPRLYAWKSAKWCRGVEFLAEDVAGFWEQGGYHMTGDPWSEERFR